MATDDGFGLNSSKDLLSPSSSSFIALVPLREQQKRPHNIHGVTQQQHPGYRGARIVPGSTLSTYNPSQIIRPHQQSSPGPNPMQQNNNRSNHYYNNNQNGRNYHKKRSVGLDVLVQLPNKKRVIGDIGDSNIGASSSQNNEVSSNLDIESSNNGNSNLDNSDKSPSSAILKDDILFTEPLNPYVHSHSNQKLTFTTIENFNQKGNGPKVSKNNSAGAVINTSIAKTTQLPLTQKIVNSGTKSKQINKKMQSPSALEFEKMQKKTQKEEATKILKITPMNQTKSTQSSSQSPKESVKQQPRVNRKNNIDTNSYSISKGSSSSSPPPQDACKEAFKRQYSAMNTTHTSGSARRSFRSPQLENSVVDLVSDDDGDDNNTNMISHVSASNSAVKNGNQSNCNVNNNNQKSDGNITHKRTYSMVNIGYIGDLNLNSIFFESQSNSMFGTYVSSIDESCFKIGWLSKSGKSKREQHWLLTVSTSDVKSVHHGSVADSSFVVIEVTDPGNIVSVDTSVQSTCIQLIENEKKPSIILISKFTPSFNEIIAHLYKYLDESQINDCRSKTDGNDDILRPFMQDNGYEKLSEISIEKVDLAWFGFDFVNLMSDSVISTGRQRRTFHSAGRPDDQNVFLVYPIDENAAFPITITNGDMRRLEPCNMLNDNLIDFGFKRLLQNRLPPAIGNSKSVYAFTNFFFTKLSEKKDAREAHKLVAKWTKNVDLFSMHYVFFPINFDEHWSLTVLVKPYLLIPYLNALVKNTALSSSHDLTSSNEDRGDVFESGFLQMDSLNIHYTNQRVTNILRNYLVEEYVEKYIRCSHYNSSTSNSSEDASKAVDDKVDTSNISNQFHNVSNVDNGAPPITYDANQESVTATASVASNTATTVAPVVRKDPLPEDMYRSLKGAFVDKLPALKCNVCKQENGTDCGMYAIKFAEMSLRYVDKQPSVIGDDETGAFNNNNNDNNSKKSWINKFSKENFNLHQAKEERKNMRRDLMELSFDWQILLNKRYRRDQQKVQEQETPPHDNIDQMKDVPNNDNNNNNNNNDDNNKMDI